MPMKNRTLSPTMKKKRPIIFDDFKIEVYDYKHGEYKYLSPRHGYKKGYKFDTLIVILYKDVILERFSFKRITRKQIQASAESFISSRKGQVMIKQIDRKGR